MIFKLNCTLWKRCAVAALAFLLLILTPTLAFADYSIGGYTVIGTGGDNIKIVDSSGKIVYEGKGERNDQGRLAPPKTSSYSTVIQAPNVEQGYAKSNNSQYSNYKGEVAIYNNGKVVGWGSLYDNDDQKGQVYVNSDGGNFSDLNNGGSSWIRNGADNAGYSVGWNQYSGGLGTVDLSRIPTPNPTPSPSPRPTHYRYYTETSSFAGTSVVYFQDSQYIGETKRMTGASYYHEDASPTYETRQYVQGDYLYTVTTKKWTRYKYQKQTWTIYKEYETTTRSKTPWYHKYTRYKDYGGYRTVISSWTDHSPYKWEYSSSTSRSLSAVRSYSTNVLIDSWQEQTQSVKREWAAVSIRAEITPNQARRGDIVTVTAYTSGPVASVWAEFPSGRVHLRPVGENRWAGTYLVDIADGTYSIPVKAKGRVNEARTTVSLAVSGDRYHVIPNITGGN
jgi:hypothetical protein